MLSIALKTCWPRMRPHNRKIWFIVLALGGMAYPALVYVGLPFLPSPLFVVIALALIALRLATVRHNDKNGPWVWPLLIAAVTLIAIAAFDSAIAVKAYPVILSLTVACVFGISLLSPPTVVERLARLTDPDLSPEGVTYTRTVTQVWTVFLVGNAVISAAVGLWGSIELWTLWNGRLSYLFMGMLFLGEFAVRRFVRKQI